MYFAPLLDAQVTVPRSVSMRHRGLDNYLHELGLGNERLIKTWLCLAVQVNNIMLPLS